MKKNGFTLIEVVGIIIVIALVSLVTVPIIIQSSNNSKASEQLCKDAIFATETYIADLKRKGDIPNFSEVNDSLVVRVSDLVNNGFLNSKGTEETQAITVTINADRTYKMECNF